MLRAPKTYRAEIILSKRIKWCVWTECFIYTHHIILSKGENLFLHKTLFSPNGFHFEQKDFTFDICTDLSRADDILLIVILARYVVSSVSFKKYECIFRCQRKSKIMGKNIFMSHETIAILGSFWGFLKYFLINERFKSLFSESYFSTLPWTLLWEKM